MATKSTRRRGMAMRLIETAGGNRAAAFAHARAGPSYGAHGADAFEAYVCNFKWHRHIAGQAARCHHRFFARRRHQLHPHALASCMHRARPS